MPHSIRVARTAAQRATALLRSTQAHPPSCPCHSNPGHHHHHPGMQAHAAKTLATPVDPARQKEYAFEMAASSIRFGPGATKEVGMDLRNMGAKRVMVVTDGTVAKLDAMRQVREALASEGVPFEEYDGVRVEPKDSSYVSGSV
jgi:hydroxyacid-oxoacid transhydrogenase